MDSDTTTRQTGPRFFVFNGILLGLGCGLGVSLFASGILLGIINSSGEQGLGMLLFLPVTFIVPLIFGGIVGRRIAYTTRDTAYWALIIRVAAYVLVAIYAVALLMILRNELGRSYGVEGRSDIPMRPKEWAISCQSALGVRKPCPTGYVQNQPYSTARFVTRPTTSTRIGTPSNSLGTLREAAASERFTFTA